MRCVGAQQQASNKSKKLSKASKKGFGGVCDQKILFVSCLNMHCMVGHCSLSLEKIIEGNPGRVK